jgi:hypothetical protein
VIESAPVATPSPRDVINVVLDEVTGEVRVRVGTTTVLDQRATIFRWGERAAVEGVNTVVDDVAPKFSGVLEGQPQRLAECRALASARGVHVSPP